MTGKIRLGSGKVDYDGLVLGKTRDALVSCIGSRDARIAASIEIACKKNSGAYFSTIGPKETSALLEKIIAENGDNKSKVLPSDPSKYINDAPFLGGFHIIVVTADGPLVFSGKSAIDRISYWAQKHIGLILWPDWPFTFRCWVTEHLKLLKTLRSEPLCVFCLCFFETVCW